MQGQTVIVIGDFNIPEVEPSRVGQDLEIGERECVSLLTCERQIAPNTCPNSEGYDETHHILQSGVVKNLQFRMLSAGLSRTYTNDNFADSAIDHIYVAGPLADRFSSAVIVPDPRFGDFGRHFRSDHAPVSSILTTYPTSD